MRKILLFSAVFLVSCSTYKVDDEKILANTLILHGDKRTGQSKWEDALKFYSTACELDPQNATAWYQNGRMKFFLGRHKEAIADYDKAIGINPEESGFYHWRAKSRFYSDDLDGAYKDFEIDFKLEPNDT